MKPFYPVRVLLCSLSLFFAFHAVSYSQCKDGEYSRSISYDTLLVGSGNNIFNFKFPQFDPTIGTLVKVDIETTTTVRLFYTLENTDVVSVLYKVRAERDDYIECSGLTSPISNVEQIITNTHNLQRFDGTYGSGPDFVSRGPIFPFNNHVKTHSILGDVAGFLGNDSVSFDYTSITNSYSTPGTNFLYNPSASDTIHLKMTYYYCSTTFLPAEIRNFFVTKRSEQNIQVNWYMPNDEPGNKYDIEKSIDGKNFVTFKSVVSTSNKGTNYQINYTPGREDKGKLFFRVRQTEMSGMVKYSAVKIVTLQSDEPPLMKVYPTVATNSVNIYFPGKTRDDWQINLVSLSGRLVQQGQFAKTNFIRLSIRDQVASGFYVIEAVNKKTMESRKSKIIIQR